MRMPCSEECSLSSLELFTVPPTQVGIESGVWDNVRSHPQFHDSNSITFDIPADTKRYISLNQTELWLSVRLQKKTPGTNAVDAILNDTVAANNADVTPINNLIHSLFSQIEVSLNGKEVENTNANYAYKAYIGNLLSYDQDAKRTFLESEFFFKDDNLTAKSVFGTEPKNSGMVARYNRFKTNQPVQMRARLHCDMFNTNKELLTSVPITIKLTRNKPSFYLTGVSEHHLIVIDDCFLRVRRITVAKEIMLHHAMELEKKSAQYPIRRTVVKVVTLPYSATSITISNIHSGIMPGRVIMGLVKNTDYDGTLDSNPFYFRNYNVQQLTLKVSSQALPYSSGIKMDFDKDTYLEGYWTLFQDIQERSCDITYKEYKNGFTLYAFDLTPDLCNGDHVSKYKDGTLELDLVFGAAITDSVTAVFYMEFDNVIEITKQRNVLYDYQM